MKKKFKITLNEYSFLLYLFKSFGNTCNEQHTKRKIYILKNVFRIHLPYVLPNKLTANSLEITDLIIKKKLHLFSLTAEFV